ncbi:MAG: hypothetical protein II126_05445, partial [Erysipelotrichaceae bacterium]|nr:hypothetical protein [Erysipelotrichaceae bacterium]
ISNRYFIWDRQFDPLKLGVETLHGTTKYGSYCIEWIMNDVDPNMAEKTSRMAEIEQAHKKEAEEYRKVLNVFERFRTNYHVAEYYRKSLQADQEYQKLARQLKVPETIEYTAKCIETAFEYLGGKQRLYMPKSEIPFKIVYDGEADLGEAISRFYSSAYVKVRPGNMRPGDQTDRDDYLLTITHELLHICQNRYRVPIDSLTNTTRFDEMVAVFMEREALAYYQYEGIITTEPTLTDSNYWGVLRVPIQTEPAGIKGKILNDMMIHEGYTLGRLAMYLADRYPDKKVTTRNLMIARTYLGIPNSDINKADIPSILCSAFGLTLKQFEECFIDWLISERKAVQAKMYDEYQKNEYKMPEKILTEPGQKHHFKVDNDVDYFLKIQVFMQKTTDMDQPCILVPDGNLAATYPEVSFLPAADYYPTSRGYFIPSFGDYGLKHNHLGIMEIHGVRKNNTSSAESGATLYVLDKTPKPVVTDDKENRKVLISFPEPSLAAKEKVIEGYCVSVLTTTGVNVSKFFEFKKDTFDRTISLSYDDIADKKDPSNPVEVTIKLCEYATNISNEKKLLGIESDPVNITINPASTESTATDILISIPGYTDHYIMEGGRITKNLGASSDNKWLLYLEGQIMPGETLRFTRKDGSQGDYYIEIIYCHAEGVDRYEVEGADRSYVLLEPTAVLNNIRKNVKDKSNGRIANSIFISTSNLLVSDENGNHDYTAIEITLYIVDAYTQPSLGQTITWTP